MITTVEDALAIAKNLHHDQIYGRSDRDYYTYHIEPVTSLAMRIAEAEPDIDPVLVGMIAALHDTLEDTGTTCEELELTGVPTNVIEAVAYLTEPAFDPGWGLNKREFRDAYIDRAVRHSIEVRIVMLAENLVNSDPVNLEVVGAERATMLIEKYAADRRVMAGSWKK